MKTMGHKIQTRIISALLVFVMVFASIVSAGLVLDVDFGKMFSALGFGQGNGGTNLAINTTPNDTSSFITPAGNWGYELKAGTQGTVLVDGVKEDVYTNNGFTISSAYNKPASGSKFDVSMTYDGAYVYVFYEFDKKEEIFWDDALTTGNYYRFDCVDFVLNLAGTEAAGSEFRILAGVEGGKDVAKTTDSPAGSGKFLKDWYVKHTDKGYNVEFVFPADKVYGRYDGDSAFTFTALSTITTAWDGNTTTQDPSRVYTTADNAAGALDKSKPSMVVLRDNNDFQTAAGNHGYEIYKSSTALALDGVKDAAYTDLGVTLPAGRGLGIYDSHASKSTYNLSLAADSEYAYFLYEFEKYEDIIAIPAGTTDNSWKYDIADFILNVTGAESLGKEFRIGLDSNYDPVQIGFNNFIDGFVAEGNYTAVKDPDSNNYNVEFRVPLSLITGTGPEYGDQSYTFTACSTICTAVNPSEISHRTNSFVAGAGYTYGYAAGVASAKDSNNTNKDRPSTVVIKADAPSTTPIADPEMDYSDVDFQVDGRWGYFITEADDSFVLDGQKDIMYKSGVKIANAHNRVQLGFEATPDPDDTYDIYIAADTENISVLWEFTDTNGIVTDGLYNYYNDAAQFVFAWNAAKDGDGGKVIDYGVGPRAGHLTYNFANKKVQIPYVVSKTEKGFNVEINIARSNILNEDTFSFLGLSSIASDKDHRTYGFMDNPGKTANDTPKDNLSIFQIIDTAREDTKPTATVDGRYSYTLEQTEDKLLNDGHIDPAYYEGLVFNNKYNRSGSTWVAPTADNTYVLYVAADKDTVGMFFDVKDTCIVKTSPSFWHADCVHFLFNKTGATDKTGGQDTHLRTENGEGTRIQNINGIDFTVTVKFTDDGYHVEATVPRSAISGGNVFSFMPRVSIASKPGVNTYGFPASAQGDASDATLSKTNRVEIVDIKSAPTMDMSTLYTDISAPVAGTLDGYTNTAAITALKNAASVAIVYPQNATQAVLDMVTLPSGTVRASSDATKTSGGIYKDYYDSLDTLKEFLPNADLLEEGDSTSGYTYVVLVGHVNSYTETQKMVNAIGYNSYGVGVFGNTISIIGPTEQLLKKAVDTFKAEVNGDLTASVLYSGTAPAVAGANLPYISGAKIVTDNGYGSYQIVKKLTDATEFDAYCDQLIAKGYKPYAYNPMGGGYTTKTFYNNTDIVTVAYGLRYSILLYSTQSGKNFYDGNDGNLDKTEMGMSVTVTSRKVADLPNNDAVKYEKVTDTVYSHATRDWDLVEIVRLENGEFIIFDAAHTDDAPAILGELYALSGGEKPVVAAWFLSHFHQDHIGGLVEIGMKYSDMITVKNVVQQLGSEHLQGTCYNYRGNQPSTSDKANILNFLPAMENLGAKVSTIATGQTYNFANASVEVLYTFGDTMPFRMAADDTNRTGAIYQLSLRVGDKVQKFNINGDTTTEEFNMCTKRYGSYLKADVVQVAHHGSGEANNRCTTYYTTIDPSYVIVSRAFSGALADQSFGASDVAIMNYVKAKYDLTTVNVDDVIIFAATGTDGLSYKPQVRRLNIPYTIGSYYEFPSAGSYFATEFNNTETGTEDSDNGIAANTDNSITTPVGTLENGSYLYVANTFYGDITTDGTKDNAYSYGIHLKGNKADNATQNEASFDAYIVAGQDGKLHVFYEAVDEYWFAHGEKSWGYAYRQDGVDFYYGFGAPGTVASDIRIKAVNGKDAQAAVYGDAKISSILKDDYAVIVTDLNGGEPVKGQPVKYTVEFTIDNNGKTFTNGDMFTFGLFLNSINDYMTGDNGWDEAAGTGHKNTNVTVDNAVSSASGSYHNPLYAPSQGKHSVIVFSSAPATAPVQRPAEDSDNVICSPDGDVVLDKEIVGSIDKNANVTHSQAVYGLGTAYADFALDGEMETVYKYGHKITDKYSDNTTMYATGDHGFEAYIVYGQDAKVHVFVEVTDKTMTTDASGNTIGYGFKNVDGHTTSYWRRDSVHFYCNFSTDGTTTNKFAKEIWIGAVAGGDQSGVEHGAAKLPETGTYFVKMTDKGYNVEFVLDRNGSDFIVGDYFEFGLYLNSANSEVADTGTKDASGNAVWNNTKYSITHASHYSETFANKYVSPNYYNYDGIKIISTESVTAGVDQAHTWTDGECTVCGEVCEHNDANEDFTCDICGEQLAMLGDADGDGLIMPSDALSIYLYILDPVANGDGFVFAGADTDGNGSILPSDALSIYLYILDPVANPLN